MSKEEAPPFDVSKVTEMFKNVKSLSDLTGSNGIIQEMIKGTVERILKAEQENHLGYEPYRKEGRSADNSRNGSSKKTLKTSSGEVEIEVPRDRKGTLRIGQTIGVFSPFPKYCPPRLCGLGTS